MDTKEMILLRELMLFLMCTQEFKQDSSVYTTKDGSAVVVAKDGIQYFVGVKRIKKTDDIRFNLN